MGKIFEGIKIGALELKNRIVMSPMGTGFGGEGGVVSARIKKYYGRRAGGGAGMIIVEATAVAPEGVGFPGYLGIWDDKFILGLAELADEIKSNGARACIQIYHAGRQSREKYIGTQPIAPSAVPWSPAGEMPRELRIEEVNELVEKFADAALRAKKAGFDAVEIHGAHGYLICQFLSPQSNRRTDEYGGEKPEQRATFALKIIKRTREKNGEDFPLLFRISADEYIEGGLTLKDTKVMTKLFEDAGIDAVHVSAGNYGAMWWIIQPMMWERGCLVPLAEEIKKGLSVPVIAVGRFNDPKFAEKIIEEGKADIIAMGRALIADPDLPNKHRDGRLEEIRMCAACGTCADNLFVSGIKCMQNAEAGRETEFQIKPAAKKKKVIIVGGGPAGMEAARVCALRGHEVMLFEKGDRVGGALNLAVIPPGKDELENIVRYYSAVLKRLNVNIVLGKEFAEEDIKKEKPDVIIVATGGAPIVPEIKGVEKKAVTAGDVLSGAATAGRKVIVLGGGSVGCEAALFLAERGKEVTIVEVLKKWGRDLSPSVKMGFYMPNFKKRNVNIITDAVIEEVKEERVYIIKEGEKQFLDADTIVLAVGFNPDEKLYNSLKDKAPEVYAIGDCKKAGNIEDAIRGAYELCYQL
ncbi:MAG: FAD-dependent oxidoreductase [bacterium]